MVSSLSVLDIVPFGQTDGGARFFALRLSRPDWKSWTPGQFVMLRPDDFGLERVWGRPFSVCLLTDRHLVCFFKVVGEGTRKLARLGRGSKITAWGPLGVGFAAYPETPTLLLAGGMGIAPFVGYVHVHPQPWNLSMLFGHREPIGCYPVDSINERVPVDSLREYDPGDLDNLIFSMREKIRDCAEQNGLVLACGPLPFLRAARKFALEFGARAQVSLEERMACGVGACLGCVHEIENPDAKGETMPAQTCLRGPVFWADRIKF